MWRQMYVSCLSVSIFESKTWRHLSEDVQVATAFEAEGDSRGSSWFGLTFLTRSNIYYSTHALIHSQASLILLSFLCFMTTTFYTLLYIQTIISLDPFALLVCGFWKHVVSLLLPLEIERRLCQDTFNYYRISTAKRKHSRNERKNVLSTE